MPKIRIPKGVIQGVKLILGLDDRLFGDFLEIVSSTPVGISAQQFKLTLETEFGDNIESAAEAAYSFGALLHINQKTSIAEITKDFIAAYAESEKAEEAELVKLGERIQALLSKSRNLRLTFKANELLSETKSLLREARILTDVRLMFNDNVIEPERYGILLHSIRIETSERYSGEPKNLFISATSNDLVELKRVIDRAIEKEAVIKKDYPTISFLEIKD